MLKGILNWESGFCLADSGYGQVADLCVSCDEASARNVSCVQGSINTACF
jgi:hypothetical protein